MPMTLIAGLGKSGRALENFFVNRQQKYWTYDDCVDADFSKVNMNSIPWRKIDKVAVTPGMSSEHPLLLCAMKNGVPLTNEIDIATAFLPQNVTVLAVTGTNGKSTVVHILSQLLSYYGVRVHLLGNMGYPFIGGLPLIKSGDYVVLELSSFQLEYCSVLKARGSLILNISPAHQNRSKSFFHYCKIKSKISQNQTSKDICLISEQNFLLKELSRGTPRFSLFSSQKSGDALRSDKTSLFFEGRCCLKWNELLLRGEHNRINILASLGLLHDLELDMNVFFEGLFFVRGLSHRIESVRTVQGIHFINDSKATNAQAVIHALKTINKESILILGGRLLRKETFFMIASYLPHTVRLIIIYGEARTTNVSQYFNKQQVEQVPDVSSAVRLAYRMGSSGMDILFSPGCSSFDLYDNFEHRGRVFVKEVLSL